MDLEGAGGMGSTRLNDRELCLSVPWGKNKRTPPRLLLDFCIEPPGVWGKDRTKSGFEGKRLVVDLLSLRERNSLSAFGLLRSSRIGFFPDEIF